MTDKNKRKNWTREETILAFDLYCKTPFSKISKTNKEIVALAELLGRTPASVGLKMSNLAHFDLALRSRNISGMSHSSKLDEEIWKEFEGNWEELSYQAQRIFAKKKQMSIEEVIHFSDMEFMPKGEDRERMMKARVGQYFFRMSVLNAYDNCCCITGLKRAELLVASHIKPWRVSDVKMERTNPANGLCLNTLHDKAFDRGLMTIDNNYKIVISKHLKHTKMDDGTKSWLEGYEGKTINLPQRFFPGKEFIEYHNDVIFQG